MVPSHTLQQTEPWPICKPEEAQNVKNSERKKNLVMKKYSSYFISMSQDIHVLLSLSVLGASRTIPFASWFRCQAHTRKMEPLNGAISIVTADHLAIRHLMTQTVGGFIGIYRHVQHIRWVHISKVGRRAVELPWLKQLHFFLCTLWTAVFIWTLHLRPSFSSLLFLLSWITYN